ncbi:hypothetical protein H0H93_002547, partial [Arthromyces matolae]
LEISLALINPNTPKWHAYLVIHKPNEISEEGVSLPTYEHLISKRNKQVLPPPPPTISMKFAVWKREIKKSHIQATAKLLNPLQKTTSEELTDAVREIMKSVKESEIPLDGNFQNCLDFVIEAVRLLWTAGYVTEKDYDAFKGVNDQIPAAIREASDADTRKRVKKSEIKATAKLLNPLHKTTYEELIEAVGEIMENVKESAIPPVGEFQNCLDLAVEAMKLLWTAGYVTEKDYDAFKEVKDNIHADTRKSSDDYTRKLIANRENTTYWQQLNKGTNRL